MIKIKNTKGEVIYTSKSAKTTKDAVQEAVKNNVSLVKADLRNLDLRGANLSRAKLDLANISGANLSFSEFDFASLKSVDFSNSILCGATLCYSSLRSAILENTNLGATNLRGANLRWANLSGANLEYATLYNADLKGAEIENIKINECTTFFCQSCPSEGSFIGWKAASSYIVKLLITEDAKRSSATTYYCRCSKAKVLDIQSIDGQSLNMKEVPSNHDSSFIYEVGKTVEVEDFDDDRWSEHSTGIHFFMSREHAVSYNF